MFQPLMRHALDGMALHLRSWAAPNQQTCHHGTASTRVVSGRTSAPPYYKRAPSDVSGYSFRKDSSPRASLGETRVADDLGDGARSGLYDEIDFFSRCRAPVEDFRLAG